MAPRTLIGYTRTLSALTLAATLAACVPAHTWAPTTHEQTAADFDRDKAECDLQARQNASGSFVLGSPAFVIGAAIGGAIATHNRVQADVNDCLQIKGWRIEQ